MSLDSLTVPPALGGAGGGFVQLLVFAFEPVKEMEEWNALIGQLIIE